MHIPLIKKVFQDYSTNKTKEDEEKVVRMICQLFCKAMVDYIDPNEQKVKEIALTTAENIMNELSIARNEDQV